MLLLSYAKDQRWQLQAASPFQWSLKRTTMECNYCLLVPFNSSLEHSNNEVTTFFLFLNCLLSSVASVSRAVQPYPLILSLYIYIIGLYPVLNGRAIYMCYNVHPCMQKVCRCLKSSLHIHILLCACYADTLKPENDHRKPRFCTTLSIHFVLPAA